jgi:hypothetical protein
MSGPVVSLQLPGDLLEVLQARLGDDVEFGPEVIVSGGAGEAHAPGGLKKAAAVVVLVTAVLKGVTASVQLAEAIRDYTQTTGETVVVVDPGTGDPLGEIGPGSTTDVIAGLIDAAGNGRAG